MINVKELKAEMVRNGYTQTTIANAIGMTPRTFSNKLKKGVFGSDEIEKMIELLQIENPLTVFFNQKVS